MEPTKIPYKEALKRLEEIVNTLQGENCDIDSMVAMTREAANLIKTCRSRLTTTEEQLRSILDSLSNE